jgi:amino acid transporter
MAFVGGYTVFLPGNWDIPTFFFSYTMIGVFPMIVIGWKLWHKTKFRKLEEIDLKTGLAEIEEYQRNYVPSPPTYVLFHPGVFPIFSSFFAWLTTVVATHVQGLPTGFLDEF